MSFLQIALLAAGIIAGFAGGFALSSQKKVDELAAAEKAEALIKNASAESAQILVRAREKAVSQKKQFEAEQIQSAVQLEKMEKMLSIKAGSFQKREGRVAELQRALEQERRQVQDIEARIQENSGKAMEELVRMTGMPADRVKQELVLRAEQEFRAHAEVRLQNMVEWTNESAVRDAKNALAEAVYRYAAATSVEHDAGVIEVPRDEIKGRIVGRSGRNIAFFEELFGVDVIFNDEPNTIIVSCFNLVQREIARAALLRLMREKIISEELIARVKILAEQDVDKILKHEGEKALKILGLANMPPDFAKLVGRLKFRTSYGQNVMGHCFEVGYFARIIASEIGADPEVAFFGGVFHDIGKAIDQEVGGSHDVLSKEILEKYGFSWEITHAAWTHHNAIPQETAEARIVQAADAISAGRPGARAESVERYLAKIKDLEASALSFGGVKKAFTINAGREVRVVVEPEKIKDEGVTPLATQIASKIQEKGGYPGKIKVTTIRHTKATNYAR